MSYEDNKAMTHTPPRTHTHRLPGAGDHTMSHQREEILYSQWVMKLWQKSSREANCKSLESIGPLNSVLLLFGGLEVEGGEAGSAFTA